MQSEIEKLLGHEFKEVSLLENSLTHPSFKVSNFQKLEFLGDRIIGLVLSEFLACQKLELKELSNQLNYLINTSTMHKIAQKLCLKNFLKHNIQDLSKKNLADCLEAIIGAVFLDSNYEISKKIIMNLWQNEIENLQTINYVNPKMQLQELTQFSGFGLPNYVCEEIKGNFKITVSLNGNNLKASAINANKHEASLQAAQELLNKMKNLKIGS